MIISPNDLSLSLDISTVYEPKIPPGDPHIIPFFATLIFLSEIHHVHQVPTYQLRISLDDRIPCPCPGTHVQLVRCHFPDEQPLGLILFSRRIKNEYIKLHQKRALVFPGSFFCAVIEIFTSCPLTGLHHFYGTPSETQCLCGFPDPFLQVIDRIF